MGAPSPIARGRKPPILAFAYISPARSSKRRMSIIVPSHSRAASGSGSAFSPMGPEASAVGSARPSANSATSVAVARDATANRRLRRVRRPRPPPRDEGLGLHRVEVLAHGAGELADLSRREVPEQHGLAVGDVDDLDRVAPDEEAVGGLRPHAAVAAAARTAAGRPASPWKTAPP